MSSHDDRNAAVQPSSRHRSFRCLALYALGAVFFAVLLAGSSAYSATTQYVYDDLGRLIQVSFPDGAAIYYQYDANGNILSIERVNGTSVTISSLAPSSGPAGTAVAINGSGFSATPAANTVRFNGALAPVTSATPTRVVAVVPTTATTGKVTVDVGTASAMSPGNFTVLPLQISSFSPVAGLPGTAVTILGTGFAPGPANSDIEFDGLPALTLLASATELRTVVPASATSGPITVTTPAGSTTSTLDFVIPPGGFQPSTVATTGRVAVNGGSQSYTISTANKIGVVLFDGVQGRNITVVQTNVTMGGGTYRVYTPSGTLLFTGNIRNNGADDIAAIPETGTYAIVLLPGSNTGSNTLRVVEDTFVTGTVNAAVPVTLLPGQNGHYMFDAVGGKGYSIVLTGVSLSGSGSVNVSVRDAGTVVKSCGNFTASSGNCDFVVPTTGTYRVRLDPSTVISASFNVIVSQDLESTLTLNAAAVHLESSIPGQNMRYTFAGNAGTAVTLLYRNGAPTVQGTLFILRPDGTVLENSTTFGGTHSTYFVDAALDTTGTHTAIVYIDRGGTANMDVSIVADQFITGTLDAVVPVSLLHGQNGHYMFEGVAGRGYSFVTTGFSSNPSGQFLAATVRNSAGTVIKNCGNHGAGSGNCDIVTPTTGTYRIRLDPPSTAAYTFNVVLSEDLYGTITPNDPAVPFVSSIFGQNKRYSFTGAAGEAVTFLYRDGVNAQGTLFLLNPDGSVLANTSAFNGATERFLDAGLTVSGTHIAVVFTDRSTANMNVSLVKDLFTPASLNAPQAFSLLQGQNGHITFQGVAGQGYSLVLTNFSTNPSGSSLTASVRKPDATELKYCGGYTATGGNCDFVTPTAGTYRIRLDPVNTNSASFNAVVSEDLAGTLTIGDPPVTYSCTVPGQNIRYSFAATAAQLIRFQYTNGTSPQGTLFILRPDGTVLAQSNSFNGATSKLLDATIPTTGTYTAIVFIDRGWTGTMDVNIQLR